MKKGIKVLGILALLALFTITAALFAACNTDDPGKNPEPDEPQTEIVLSLKKSAASLLVGDKFQIEAIYSGADGETVSYTSDNAAVAKVSDDGMVEAMGVGSAKVTVTYSEKSVTCSINVFSGETVPVLVFEDEIAENITIFSSGSLNLGVKAFYNNRYFDDVIVTYEYSDESVGTVDENGVFVPAKGGKTSVTLKGNWRGFEGVLMEKTVNVTVQVGTIIDINNGQSDFNLYTVNSFGGKTYQTSMDFNFKVFEDDGITPVTGASVSVEEGSELIEYKDGKILSTGKYGTAVIAVSGEDDIHGKYYHEVKVKILRPVTDSDYVGNIDANDGTLDIDAMIKIFGDADTKVYDAESATLGLEVIDGKIFGFVAEGREEPEVQTLTVYNDEVGYTIGLKAYAGVIRTVDDFKKLITSTSVESNGQETKDNVNTLTGYYILGNDINAGGLTFAKTGVNITGMGVKEFQNVGFRGIFDGKGHIVSNMTAPRFGIFGSVGKDAIIRNVAFTDVISDGYADAALAGWICGAKLENIYISVSEIKAQSAVVACNLSADSSLNNCIFEVKSFSKPKTAYGVTGYMLDGKIPGGVPTQWTNSFVIASFETTVATNYGYVADAEFVDGVATGKTTTETYFSIPGLKRYSSVEKFKSDAANNKTVFDGFDKNYWEMQSGVPVWAGLPASVNFDVSTGKFTSSDLELIFGADEPDKTIVAATFNGTGLSVENGVISGITVKDAVVGGEMTVSNSYRTVSVNVKAYSKIFRTADDLFYQASDGKYYSYFDMTDTSRWESITLTKNDKTQKAFPKITGVYLLGNDIDLSGDTRVMAQKGTAYYDESYYNWNATVSGFVGVFYGGGHTITGMTVGRGGMFGQIGEGWIQNLALKDVKFSQETSANYSYIFCQYFCGYQTTRRAVIRDVYVSVAQGQLTYSATATDSSRKWVDSGMLASRTSEHVAFENVVIDFSKLGEINVIGRGVFTFGGNTDFNNSKNVFVISSAPIIMGYGGSNTDGRYAKLTDAYNKRDVDFTGKQWVWIHGASIAGYDFGILNVNTSYSTYMKQGAVYRFETVDEMKAYIAANNIDLGAFSKTCWDISTGVPRWI